MAWHPPFDLYHWFVNVFAGDINVFLAVSFIVIAALAGMFRMAGTVVGAVFGLFVILLSVYMGSITLLVVVIVALILGWLIARLFR